MALVEPPEQVNDPGAAAPAVPAGTATMSARAVMIAPNLFIAKFPLFDVSELR